MARKPPESGTPPAAGPGGLSPEDRDLWRRVTRGLRPLDKRPPRKDSREGSGAQPPAEGAEGATALPAPGRKPRLRRGPAAAAGPAPPPELEHGRSAGLDRRSALRLRRGQYPIDARIDLHGLTQAAAERALAAFLAEAQAAGRRCVLVITGKGTTTEGGGVLRREVPRWLNQAPNRARVLGFDHALPRDGGLGALYVLLRRAARGAESGGADKRRTPR